MIGRSVVILFSKEILALLLEKLGIYLRNNSGEWRFIEIPYLTLLVTTMVTTSGNGGQPKTRDSPESEKFALQPKDLHHWLGANWRFGML